LCILFTWASNNYQQSYFSASSTSLSVSESLLETFSQSETGTDTVGAGGTLAGGSDSFSWWQGGNNTYSLSQSATSTSHNWSLVFWQGLSNTWNDHGGDVFGPGGTTTAGNDGYLWSAYFQGSGSVSDSGVSTTATQYYLQGFNTATSSTYDAGNDTLSAGTLTGDDNYAFDETGQDTYSGSGASGSLAHDVAYKIGNSDSLSYHDAGTLANDVATPSSSHSYTLYDADNPSYSLTVLQTATNHPNSSDGISSTLGYTLSAQGGLSTSGTHSLGSLSFSTTQTQSSLATGTDSGYDGASYFLENSLTENLETDSVTGSSSFSDTTWLKTRNELQNFYNVSSSVGSVGMASNTLSATDSSWSSAGLSANNAGSSTWGGSSDTPSTYANSGTQDSVIANDYNVVGGFWAFPLPPVGSAAVPGKLFGAVEALAARDLGYAPQVPYKAGVQVQDDTTSYGLNSYLNSTDAQTGSGSTFAPATAITVGYRREQGGGIDPVLPATAVGMPGEEAAGDTAASNGLLAGGGGDKENEVLTPNTLPPGCYSNLPYAPGSGGTRPAGGGGPLLDQLGLGDNPYAAFYIGLSVQGSANVLNGAQDIIVGLGNLAANRFGLNIPSPDWSRGVGVHEDNATHNASKEIGGGSLLSLPTGGGGAVVGKLGCVVRGIQKLGPAARAIGLGLKGLGLGLGAAAAKSEVQALGAAIAKGDGMGVLQHGYMSVLTTLQLFSTFSGSCFGAGTRKRSAEPSRLAGGRQASGCA
jgi:hypothetical protein